MIRKLKLEYMDSWKAFNQYKELIKKDLLIYSCLYIDDLGFLCNFANKQLKIEDRYIMESKYSSHTCIQLDIFKNLRIVKLIFSYYLSLFVQNYGDIKCYSVQQSYDENRVPNIYLELTTVNGQKFFSDVYNTEIMSYIGFIFKMEQDPFYEQVRQIDRYLYLNNIYDPKKDKILTPIFKKVKERKSTNVS